MYSSKWVITLSERDIYLRQGTVGVAIPKAGYCPRHEVASRYRVYDVGELRRLTLVEVKDEHLGYHDHGVPQRRGCTPDYLDLGTLYVSLKKGGVMISPFSQQGYLQSPSEPLGIHLRRPAAAVAPATPALFHDFWDFRRTGVGRFRGSSAATIRC